MTTIDPALVHAWLAARSLSRGLPVPVADSGGWRVDTNGEAELRRYVFAEAGAGLTRIARSIHEPRIFIKLCSDAQTLRALPPPGWAIVDANRMMTSDAAPPTATDMGAALYAALGWSLYAPYTTAAITAPSCP